MAGLRNIGIFAHVDAGKTTLTERLLTHAGAIRSPGSVDQGTAHTDSMDIERRRGISVRAGWARMDWRGTAINLIDTPGHVDFAAEVERALWALDGAVLLLSAAEGVQPQSEVLFEALRENQVPTLIFINKTDREGADVQRVMAQARGLWNANVVLMETPEQAMEALAELDEQALEDFLSGTVYEEARLMGALAAQVRRRAVLPALTGSALKDQGIERLLDAIVTLLPEPQGRETDGLCGVVFAVRPDKVMGRAAYVRMFSGALHTRDALEMPLEQGITQDQPRAAQRKITQIRALALDGRGADVGVLSAGEIGVVYGLGEAKVGQVLGSEALLPRKVSPGSLQKPLIMVRAEPEKPEQMNALRQALMELDAEDPMLGVQWSNHTRELTLSAMGAIQLEVLSALVQERYQLKMSLGAPQVIYKETIAQPARGFVAYTMPKPCWAILEMQIEPLPRGSGVVFESRVPVRDIAQRYQNQVRQALPLALKQGMLGWQVTDVKITLTGGNHHLIHTHPLDFIVATPMAFLDGLRRGGSTLLEPMLDMRITAPEGCAGRLMSDMTLMRGEIMESELAGGLVRMRAQVPVSTSMDYPTQLAALSGGRGAMSARLMGYRECPLELGASTPRRGVDPLDTSKYILAARSALEGGIFDI
jgi:ribosomal protection tetracycline resistance protein